MDFLHTCTIELPLSKNEHHAITYGTPTTVECNYKDLMSVDRDKNIDAEAAWLAVPPETSIQQKARVTLDNGKQYTASSSIRKIERLSDGEIDYISVILGYPKGSIN